MAYELTKRQQKVLEIILETITSQGYPPTVRELRDKLGVNSIRGASIHLDALERKGYIKRTGKARGIRVLDATPVNGNNNDIRIPLVGQIQAGYPLLAEQNIESYLNVKKSYLRGNRKVFALRVKGESMIEAGIYPGDIALITPTQHAESGDIVVALLEDSATLKKFYKVDDYVALLPANPNFDPIIGKDFSIQGKLIGIIRSEEEHAGSLTKDACLVPVYYREISDLPKGHSILNRWAYGTALN